MSSNWRIDSTQILTRPELHRVIGYLQKGKRSITGRMRLVIFRLAACCGLRASEIIALRLRDLHLADHRPYLRMPGAITKCHWPRRVPLWWDQGTLADIRDWYALRIEQGADEDALFICQQSDGRLGQPIIRQDVRFRFRTACKCLGRERLRSITIHTGRHTFASHALRVRTLAEVRDALGHRNIATTSMYSHIVTDDEEEDGIEDVFKPRPKPIPRPRCPRCGQHYDDCQDAGTCVERCGTCGKVFWILKLTTVDDGWFCAECLKGVDDDE